MADDGSGGYLTETYGDRFPRASVGKRCVRFKRLQDVDEREPAKLIREGARRRPVPA